MPAPDCPHTAFKLFRAHVGRALCNGCGEVINAPTASVAPITPINLNQRRVAK